ncbi:MAG: hypothetical protein PHD91_02410 [bacterium]|jgi:hypothetical protein|nr:hypothetical protein [bacterium]MDD3804704.1 hypothetical protein [bacterium]MDD4152556.1 hypothetical protein [bacterium]
MRIPVTCICGHPIDADEVVQMGAYMRLSGPNVVYVRFRCSVCNHLGEKLVEQQRWHEQLHNAVIPKPATAPVAANNVESERFASMGPIRADEQIDFHLALAGMSRIEL